MIKVGLTGNIGSGKTTVCRIFESLGVPVFYADVEAKKLYKREDVKKELKNTFGEKVFNRAGEIDFKRLAGVIFNDQESLRFVNDLIHPLVFEVYQNWLEENNNMPYTIHESAILFENHLQNHFDKIIVVSSPENIRLERVLQRDGEKKEKILARMKNQWFDIKKEELADWVIVNDGKVWLIPQVVSIHKELTSR